MAETQEIADGVALLEKAIADADRAYSERNAEWKAGRLDIMRLSGGDDPQIDEAVRALNKAGVSLWDDARNLPRGPSQMLAKAKEMIA